jgi:hypothetical protein
MVDKKTIKLSKIKLTGMDRMNRMRSSEFNLKTSLFFYPVLPVHPVKK